MERREPDKDRRPLERHRPQPGAVSSIENGGNYRFIRKAGSISRPQHKFKKLIQAYEKRSGYYEVAGAEPFQLLF